MRAHRRASGLRFRPPPLVLSPELRWMLLRAFGRPELPWNKPLDTAAAIGLTQIFCLGHRIGRRTGGDRLLAELGPQGRQLAVEAAVTATRTRRALDQAQEVADLAARARIPVVFLKGTALHLTGLVSLGARAMADVDVLVPEDGAAPLARELTRAGLAPQGLAGSQHLPPFAHPTPGAIPVEVHHRLVGIGTDDRRVVTFADLARPGHGALAPAAGLPGDAHVLAPPVQLAHLIVHGLFQHFTGLRYPLTRPVADCLDLGLARDEDGDRLLVATLPWIRGTVAEREIRALSVMCARFDRGELPPPGSDDQVLLDHVIGATLDPSYEQALRLTHVLHPPSLAPWPRAFIQRVATSIAPPRLLLERLYGPRRWLRLVRLADLAGRLVRYSAAALQLRAKRRIGASAPQPSPDAKGEAGQTATRTGFPETDRTCARRDS